MKKILVIVILICIHFSSRAQQFIGSRSAIRVFYGSSFVLGGETVSDGSYTAPSLVNNFKGSTAYGGSFSYRLKKNISVRLQGTYTGFKNWEYQDQGANGRFAGATFSAFSIQPMIGLVMPFKENGIQNVLSVSAHVGPAINLNSLELSRPVFVSTDSEGFVSDSFSSFGIASTFNADVNVTQRLMLGISVDITHSWLSSPLFDDKTLFSAAVGLNAGWRLCFDKRYKYDPRW